MGEGATGKVYVGLNINTGTQKKYNKIKIKRERCMSARISTPVRKKKKWKGVCGISTPLRICVFYMCPAQKKKMSYKLKSILHFT